MRVMSLVCIGVVFATSVAVADAPSQPATDAAPVAQEVARGVWLIPGGIRPGRQPDGNSVVFEAPAGLVVVDTGRHAWHRDAILGFARERKSAVVAVVNTHWHLDHVSGNPALRAAYPDVRVYASNAIDGALSGFLARSAADSASYLGDPQIPESMREDIRGDLATIRAGDALRPDVVVGRSQPLEIGGKSLQVYLASAAVTEGDLWLYDEATRVAVLGDLVTLPSPFLDTACPGGWKTALDAAAAVPFELAIPGHGPPMKRADFELYRRSFAAFLDCAASDRAVPACATEWLTSVAPLLEGGESAKTRAQPLVEYYVGLLRENRAVGCGL